MPTYTGTKDPITKIRHLIKSIMEIGLTSGTWEDCSDLKLWLIDTIEDE